MGDEAATASAAPATVRRWQTTDSLSLADLTALSEELAKVAGCCEQILNLLPQEHTAAQELVVESLWTTALLSYRRCFSEQEHAAALSAEDFAETGLRGDVKQWHTTLERLHEYYVDSRVNAHGNFVTGVSQDSEGNANGVAVTSAPRPQPDETTIRQTGRLAVELGRVIDERIRAHQQRVYEAVRSLSAQDLSLLPEIYVAPPKSEENTQHRPPA
ncbi:hypothetical protein GCM10027174_19680 [Salinifilum aidingensis]